MPAANSMAAQVNMPNWGLEWSGPSLVFPTRDSAVTRTKATTAVTIRK